MSALEFDPAGIDGLATRASALGEELQRIRGTWAKATGTPGSAFGLAELESAYQSMQAAWDAELGVYVTVLDQAGANLKGSGSTYSAAESAGTVQVQHLRGPR